MDDGTPTPAYTDGACSGNPGPGGWAWIVPDGPFAAGPDPDTTNQRMEILAALEAVRSLDGPVEVVSDSTYVVNCFRDGWWKGWIAKGWKNSQRKPVANRDLWEPLIELVNERGDVTFRWVKGHANNTWNDYADRLAVEAGFTQQPREGDATPTEIGEPDRSRGRSAAGSASTGTSGGTATSGGGATSDRPYAGHAIGMFGHRPPELGGYEENELTARLRERLTQILAGKRELDRDLVVVSGLRLGAESIGAEVAVDLAIPLSVVLPFPDPDSVWPKAARTRFAELVAAARETKLLERKVPTTNQRIGASLQRRDAWLARHLDEAIVVWDGKDARLARMVSTLEQHLGEDVWVVNPQEL